MQNCSVTDFDTEFKYQVFYKTYFPSYLIVKSLATFQKTFSKFYRRHYELVSKFKVGLKSLLQQGLSEPEFYGDMVYKLKKIFSRADFSDQSRKVIMRYKRVGYNINVMRQSACILINPITVYSFASRFNLHAGWSCIRLNDRPNIKLVDLFKVGFDRT